MSRSGFCVAVMALCVACLLAAAPPSSESPPKRDPKAILVGEAASPSTIRGMGMGGPGDRKVDDALWRIVTIRNQRYSLPAFAESLEAALQIPVVIDRASLEESGYEFSTEFLVDASETTVHEVLSCLKDVQVGYSIQWGRLVLQYSFAAAEARTLRIYSIASLDAAAQENISKLVMDNCNGPWDVDEPGTGFVERLGTSLLVRTNAATQAEVETFLNLLAANVAGPTR